MKTREEIIHGMCLTYRHDYGITKEDNTEDIFSSGMTKAQQLMLYSSMSQIFDHNVEELYIAALKYETIKSV